MSKPLKQVVKDYLEFTGNTQAINTVQLVARVEGYLEKVFFRDGERVKKGQMLFQIQQNTYVAMLKQAEGNVLTQKARLDHARVELARNTDLYRQKAAAQTEVENWRFQLDSAQADLMSAEALRDLAKLNLDYTSIAAPFDGRIDRRLVDPGNLVGPGNAGNASAAAGTSTGTLLAQVTQVNPIYVYFNVSEKDISVFSGLSQLPEEQAKPDSHPIFMGLANEEGYPHTGHLDFTSPSVSSTTGTLLMRGVFPNADGEILPGQYARIQVPIGKAAPAILVPKVAIGFDQRGDYVLVVDEKNTVERRTVKIGASHNELYVIESGLTGDERVIVNGLLRATPGRKVTPELQAAE